MKNKYIKLIMSAIATAFVLVASGCGEKMTVTISSEEFDIGNVSGETISTQDISALCPDGWANVEAYDITAEEENVLAGNELKFVKGGSTQNDLGIYPFIDIIYYSADQQIMQVDPEEWYDNVVLLESFDTGDTTWEGYSGESIGASFVYLYADYSGDTVEVWLYTCEGSGVSAALTDEDVLAILQSITVN